jgi:hypothetical protein
MTKKQHTVADALHYAADHVLAATKYEYRCVPNKHKYSCCAATDACIDLNIRWSVVIKGLENMGCPTSSLNAFNDQGYDKFSEEAQGMRYMWLKWAALMAEEQGV